MTAAGNLDSATVAETRAGRVAARRSDFSAESTALKAEVKGVSFFYGAKQALKNIHLPVPEQTVTALIGPSGCGKSTLLRCFNRMHDLYPNNRYEGEIPCQTSGLQGFSVRVLPYHVDAELPQELPLVAWE